MNGNSCKAIFKEVVVSFVMNIDYCISESLYVIYC